MNGRAGAAPQHHSATEIVDGIAVVSIRPAWSGAPYPSFFSELREVLTDLDQDPDVRALVITGGETCFFDGIPAQWMAAVAQEGEASIAHHLHSAKLLVDALLAVHVPTVAAVQGTCSSIGNQLAFACDGVVAASDARFKDHHVIKGIAAGDGGPAIWPLLVGPAIARQILLWGRELSAKDAFDLGIVLEIASPVSHVSVARDYAANAAQMAPLAFAATKLAINTCWTAVGANAWPGAMAAETIGIAIREANRTDG